jgi:hypothetical protein
MGGFDAISDIPILKASQKDDYASCVEKVYQMFQFHKNSNFDWYFIGDDDTYVNVPEFVKLVETLSKDNLEVHGSKMGGKSKELGLFRVIYGGTGIYMNSRTFKTIGSFINKNDFNESKFSDVQLALAIAYYNRQNKEKIRFTNHKYHYRQSEYDSENFDPQKLVTCHLKDKFTFDEITALINI